MKYNTTQRCHLQLCFINFYVYAVITLQFTRIDIISVFFSISSFDLYLIM
jgi:hypothetical protein